jgi:hypothetical protein
MFTPEEIKANYERFMCYIDEHISEPRKGKLTAFYDLYADRISMMPASYKEHFHNAFPGGYIDHVMRVIDIALNLKSVWAKWGANANYTDEELVFAAMNHDLGKMGTAEHEMYLPNDSEWHRKNQGVIYKINPEPDFMPMSDRSLFLLQQHGIECSINEWIAIKTHDGLYEDGNKAYLIYREAGAALKTSLPILLHQADSMAARIEFEKWTNSNQSVRTNIPKKKVEPKEKNVGTVEELNDIFGNLFNPSK